MKKWHKEPLLHFLIIGTAIFAVFSIANKEEAADSGNKIVVSSAEIKRLSDSWSKRRNRPPSEIELQGLIDSYIKEEIYYREALSLGLDQNDTIIRRRLMQKMEFLSDDLAELNQPDEAELNKYFIANKNKYQFPARISFTHIYFSLDSRGAKALEDSKCVLADLDVPRAPERGDRFMMKYDFVHETPLELTRIFGSGFAEQLFTLETNTWQGPVSSGYGFHLVRISEKTDARAPELAAVIEKVRTDFMFEQRQKTNKEIYDKFKERYEIVIEDMTEQSGMAEAMKPAKESS
jgi:hypothetical protein